MSRCAWVPEGDPLYVAYHDEEWGVPSHDERHLFEMLVLEGAQAGLSWSTILRKREGYRKAFAGFEVPMPDGQDLGDHRGRTLILGIRPSDLEDAAVWSNPELPTIEVTADVTEELGSEVNVLFTVDASPVGVEEVMEAADEPLEEAVFLLEENRAVFCARVDARTRARPGARVRLSVDPRRFHFFDPETGLAIGASKPATAPA